MVKKIFKESADQHKRMYVRFKEVVEKMYSFFVLVKIYKSSLEEGLLEHVRKILIFPPISSASNHFTFFENSYIKCYFGSKI